MNYQALDLDKLQVAACSQWRAPDGTFFLELPVTLVFPKFLVHSTVYPDERQPTPAEFPFVLKAIGVLNAGILANIYGRFQWPNGKYFSNIPVDLAHLYNSGQWGRQVEP
jgi:hypothetical protein